MKRKLIIETASKIKSVNHHISKDEMKAEFYATLDKIASIQ